MDDAGDLLDMRLFLPRGGPAVVHDAVGHVHLGVSLAFPGEHIIHDLGNPAFALHVLVSIVAYSLFAIAALLAVLMLFLEKACTTSVGYRWCDSFRPCCLWKR
jgi:ABC-type uncharacterized transport system permease subunit